MFAVNEVYSDILLLIVISRKVWTKLEQSEGAPWPVGRDDHAACCLNFEEDEPVLLMTGGTDDNGNTLNDVWLLDVNSRRWREVREV